MTVIDSRTAADTTEHEGVVLYDGREFCCIPDVDRMPPFLMSIVSDTDLWMYVSSRGGLTCGRVNEDAALFPYETDDKLHAASGHTGPFTQIRIHEADGVYRLWQPFQGDIDSVEEPTVRRNLYKSVAGNEVMFEEIDEASGLVFRYRWSNAEKFGFVRTSTLENRSGRAIEVELLDGLLNLMPGGANMHIQRQGSCLVNAYTRADVDRQTHLATVALSAIIVDQSTPVESLQATAIWCVGLPHPEVLLSLDQLGAFRRGDGVETEWQLKGRRAGYLVSSSLLVQSGGSTTWRIGADVMRSHVQVEELRALLASKQDVGIMTEQAIAQGTEALRKLIASADGLQCTGDQTASAHHYANVLFNVMRGGVLADGYRFPTVDFTEFVQHRNKDAAHRHQGLLAEFSKADTATMADMLRLVEASADSDLIRLGYEYLPITFSRRHGDPSRPWNRFTIQLRNADGSRALAYQGNWRDVFQNWEALLASYPECTESVIAKFLNASTMDGFNPYRVSREGIDWETPNPDDPWANIGYWGDHQIVYLTRLLEASLRTHPGKLASWLGAKYFAYANVPYRLREYSELVKHPRDTVVFDYASQKRIEGDVTRLGADGKLVLDGEGQVKHVTLVEKLLVPILAKLSNFVPDGGIWMNTQRPEWNDANNALVGNGVSMVTLCYLRRHLALCGELFANTKTVAVDISTDVREWLHGIHNVLQQHRYVLSARRISLRETREIIDGLGGAFAQYRRRVYADDASPTGTLALAEARSLFAVALAYIDHAIAANRREDGLYHSYNLLDLTNEGEAVVTHLYEMLEGQVAVLSSGVLTAIEAVGVLESLYKSAIYREDQQSFMLYPERTLPSFLEKNIVPKALVAGSRLLGALLEAGDTRIVSLDAAGNVRFNSQFRMVSDVEKAIAALAKDAEWTARAKQDGPEVVRVFGEVFNLRAFTGRSGTMYGYEGLGCIYWHMVAKLLLAVQENYYAALKAGVNPGVIQRLADLYYRVRAGLGFNKKAAEYGAFPTDPYSHTPRHSGAQQPGMTGQVKEEILARWGELGISVQGDVVRFAPTLLRRSEFLQESRKWRYLDSLGQWRELSLAPGTLAFTYCSVPIMYRIAKVPMVAAISRSAFERQGAGDVVEIKVNAEELQQR